MRVAIIGGGFSGTMAAVQLVRYGQVQVALVERRARLGAGAAYSTSEEAHFLNVRAKDMSAFPEAPDHFAQWAGRQGLGGPDDFVRRRDYRRYLTALLEEARKSPRVRVVEGEAVSLAEDADSQVVTLASGERLGSDATVLAGGNYPSRLPGETGIDPKRCIDDPWSAEGVARLKALAETAKSVVLVGTGLTMVDVSLTLIDSGFEGRITATSRRGLMPRPHAAIGSVPTERPLPSGLTALMRETRRLAKTGGDWRAAVDGLRAQSIALWRGFDEAERRSFLRHVRPWWDVHRHRIAPQVAERIAALADEGRLEVIAGRIAGVSGNKVRIAQRGGRGELERRADAVVNCTGPQGQIERVEDPLVRNLLARGLARPDSLGLGLDVDSRSRVIGGDGKPSDTLFAIGPLTRGAFWEIVAVPDIRVQAREVARVLSAY